MFTLDFQHAYLAMTIPFLVLWLGLFLRSRKTRREQLLMSILLVPIGIASELIYFRDYWLPRSVASFTLFGVPVLLEDALFAFAIGGIAAVIYEVLARRHLRRRRGGKRHSVALFALLAAAVMLALWFAGVNSIYATSIGAVLMALLIIIRRHDLLRDSFFSGLMVMATMFWAYSLLLGTAANGRELLLQAGLLDDIPTSANLLGVPLTELLWGFAFGMMAGPAYEYLRNYRLS